MKALIALTCILVMAKSALADPYSAAIQQARRVANQETDANRHLMDNPQPAPAPPDNSNPSENPVLRATLQNIESLRSDFDTLSGLTNSDSIAAAKQGLTNDLATAAQGTKPSSQSISKLADDLAVVIAGNAKLRPQHPTLAQYVHAVSNSAHLTDAQQQMVFTEVRKILVKGGANPDDVTNVVNDIKAIASETK